ncbi:hypothetical protein OIU84_010212 [Salix udensis]|uniref:Uncharacterized protein n=1 Tax=Salix udensis TaxID=889485 RepID=A0AAD6JKI7_9ROSI|nr:hypothetical protein OIU84_010212 [Salix udensis]
MDNKICKITSLAYTIYKKVAKLDSFFLTKTGKYPTHDFCHNSPSIQPFSHGHSDKTKHTNQQAELIFLIDDIYRGSTRQQPVKDPKQDTAGYFLHFPEHQTLLFTTRTLNLMIFSLLSMASHLLFHSLKALLGLLRHTFFSCKLVAPQIHLPAGDTVHHFWMAMQAMTSYTADRFYELGIRFRPLVEVHIIRSDRHPSCVSRVMDTV